MQERGVRNNRIEFLDQAGKPIKEKKFGLGNRVPDAPKKSWAARHPLISVIGVGAISIALAFSLKNGCEEKGEREGSALIKKDPEREMREQRRKEHIEKLQKIKQIIKFQKKLAEDGWFEKQESRNEYEEDQEDDRFRSALEKMGKNELVELLVKQSRVISRLRDEYSEADSDTNDEVSRELSREEMKRVAIQDQIDFIEIDERGLITKSPEELEELIRELDELIINQETYPAEIGAYWEIASERTLLAKALEEVSFWREVLPTQG
jgi:hypothetical protein